MLIRFKVSNFLSFKEETEFSMIAGSERIHPNHIVKGEKNQPNLVRAALIYGANAAGKSNFVKAISYAKYKILYSGKLFVSTFDYLNARKPFKLDNSTTQTPSSFEFEFITNDVTYIYSFKHDDSKISFEKLVRINNGKEILLFERDTKLKESAKFRAVYFLKTASDSEFLKFVQRSVKDDTLFLTHCFDNNVEWFKDVYSWFKDSLEIVFPDTKDYKFKERLLKNYQFKDFFSDLLNKAGTGISFVSVTDFTKVWSKDEFDFWVDLGEEPLLLNLHHGKTHLKEDEESEGTQRLFNLAFPFYNLATSETPKVYIIDELERNLHTNLSYMLLKSYLEQEGKGQLIATTHDTHLLDLDLLRRDEIWFAEKDEYGATQLYSLYDFNPRYDKNIEKDYLLGRYGAIPFLGNLEFKRQLAKNGKNGKSKK